MKLLHSTFWCFESAIIKNTCSESMSERTVLTRRQVSQHCSAPTNSNSGNFHHWHHKNSLVGSGKCSTLSLFNQFSLNVWWAHLWENKYRNTYKDYRFLICQCTAVFYFSVSMTARWEGCIDLALPKQLITNQVYLLKTDFNGVKAGFLIHRSLNRNRRLHLPRSVSGWKVSRWWLTLHILNATKLFCATSSLLQIR